MTTYTHPYISLAVQSVDHFLNKSERLPCPKNLTPDLKGKAGVFVSIKRKDQLRGCVGTLNPQEPNLAMEIIENAIKAAIKDPRFSPITPQEVPSLNFSVDVIFPMEKIEDPLDLDPKIYGLVVRSKERQGVLLPNLEGVKSIEDQIKICRAKGRIKETDPQELYRFKVDRFR